MSTNKTLKIKTHKCVIKHICIDQCSGSMTFWNGSGSGAFSWSFSSLPSSTKKKVFPKFFCVFLTLGTLTFVFKDNMSLRSHKAEEIMLYVYFSAQWWKDPDQYKWLRIRIRILETSKHTDPTEHWHQTCDHSRTRHHGRGCRQGCWVGSRRGWAAGGKDSCSWRPTAGTWPQQGHRVHTVQHMQQAGFKNCFLFSWFIHRGDRLIFIWWIEVLPKSLATRAVLGD